MKKSPLKMTKVALENLFRQPATVPYPLERKPMYPATRGHIAIDKDTCNLCLLCDRRCPTGAIKVDRTGKTWAIDRLSCIQCNYCVEVCPKKCLWMENLYAAPTTEKAMVVVPIPFTPPTPRPKPSPPADAAPPSPAATPPPEGS